MKTRVPRFNIMDENGFRRFGIHMKFTSIFEKIYANEFICLECRQCSHACRQPVCRFPFLFSWHSFLSLSLSFSIPFSFTLSQFLSFVSYYNLISCIYGYSPIFFPARHNMKKTQQSQNVQKS